MSAYNDQWVVNSYDPRSIPVLEGEEQDRFLGMLRHKDVLDFYRHKVQELYEAPGSEPVPETGGSS